MSEYQYYEFRTVDHPLNERQMRELRAVSRRAVITPTSFVNEYDWGDFKGILKNGWINISTRSSILQIGARAA
jgi:hypothetical protein